MEPSTSAFPGSAREPEKQSPLVARVAELAHLERDEAERALNTVLCIFEQRLSGGEARKMEAKLARAMEPFRAECNREDEEQAEPFDLSEFFSRAASRLPRRGLETGHIVASVFAALRERLSKNVATEVGNELPADLRTLWDDPLPKEAPIDRLPNLVHNKSHRVTLTNMAEGKPNHSRLDLPTLVSRLAQKARTSEPEAESMAVSTLWFLLRRIPAPIGEKLSERLPREIQVQVQDALLHGGDVPDWGLDKYYEQVAEQLGVRRRDVVPLVHHVLRIVRKNIPDDIRQSVAGQLPGLMKDLWLGTPFGGDDPRTC